MGTAVASDTVGIADAGVRVALFLGKAEKEPIHIGVVFTDEADPQFLHFGWEDRLFNLWQANYIWAAPEIIDEEATSIISLCKLIFEEFQKHRAMPYGLSSLGTTFDEQGHLQLGPGATGLTCATFVIAVFSSIGIQLLDETTWPVRREDDAAFVARFQQYTAIHDRMKNDLANGATRIRPSEVVAACAFDTPATFSQCMSEVDSVIALLRTQEPSAANV